MASAFASLINGGTYYEPHIVTKITDASGNTISTIEPKALKQTVSESTSDQIRDYLYSVVSEGTGKTAKGGRLFHRRQDGYGTEASERQWKVSGLFYGLCPLTMIRSF